MVQAPSRRDRVRAATVREIKDTARRLLIRHGPDAVTLRAIAREMGMTAPGLYRYFGSHEELVKHVIADIFSELADDLQAAIAAAGAAAAGEGPVPELTAKMAAACLEFRRWALDHQEVFAHGATPVNRSVARPAGNRSERSRRCGRRKRSHGRH